MIIRTFVITQLYTLIYIKMNTNNYRNYIYQILYILE